MDITLLTGKEIAQILKISKALAYRLISKGEIASVRFGRTVRVREDDLRAFLTSKSSDANPHTETQLLSGTAEHR